MGRDRHLHCELRGFLLCRLPSSTANFNTYTIEIIPDNFCQYISRMKSQLGPLGFDISNSRSYYHNLPMKNGGHESFFFSETTPRVRKASLIPYIIN